MTRFNAILLSTVIAVSSISAATAAPFNGAYVGAQGGYELFSNDYDFTGTGALAGVTARDNDHPRGWTGGLFAGYGQRIGQFYLGGEVEGNIANTDKTVNDSVTASEVKHSYDVGISARAGFFPLHDLLVYGKLGGVYSKIKANDTEIIVPGTTISTAKTTWLPGLRTGLGAETALSGNWLIRAGWDYTHYQDSSADAAVTGIGSVGSVKLSPDSNTFRIGLAYAF